MKYTLHPQNPCITISKCHFPALISAPISFYNSTGFLLAMLIKCFFFLFHEDIFKLAFTMSLYLMSLKPVVFCSYDVLVALYSLLYQALTRKALVFCCVFLGWFGKHILLGSS